MSEASAQSMPNPIEEAQPKRGTAMEKEYPGRLLLEEMDDQEINQAVLQPMLRTGKAFWIVVAVLVAVVGWGLFAWGYQIFRGFGVAGINRPVYWGFYLSLIHI